MEISKNQSNFGQKQRKPNKEQVENDKGLRINENTTNYMVLDEEEKGTVEKTVGPCDKRYNFEKV